MTNKPTVSIVIPCYNEEANLSLGVLDQVAAFLEKQPYSYEVIVADDGSSDGSLALCRAFAGGHPAFRVLPLAHGGKPQAIYGGLKEARGDIVLFTDMDQSAPIEELNKLLPWFEQGYEVVIGSRGLQRLGFSPLRKITSRAFYMLRSLILLPKIDDTQCGFKAFRTEVLKDIFPRLSFFSAARSRQGWVVSAFDVELLFIADKWGYPIKEVEVAWSHRDQSTTKGRSKGQFLHESLEMASEILSVVRNNLRGRYQK